MEATINWVERDVAKDWPNETRVLALRPGRLNSGGSAHAGYLEVYTWWNAKKAMQFNFPEDEEVLFAKLDETNLPMI